MIKSNQKEKFEITFYINTPTCPTLVYRNCINIGFLNGGQVFSIQMVSIMFYAER